MAVVVAGVAEEDMVVVVVMEAVAMAVVVAMEVDMAADMAVAVATAGVDMEVVEAALGKSVVFSHFLSLSLSLSLSLTLTLSLSLSLSLSLHRFKLINFHQKFTNRVLWEFVFMTFNVWFKCLPEEMCIFKLTKVN